MPGRARALLPGIALVMLLSSSALFAQSGDRIQIGKSIQVEQDESAGDLVCIACSIDMAGSCGDLVAVGGSVTIEGIVHGDAVAIGGAMRLNENASVNGDVAVIGGRISRSSNAVVKGDVSTQSGIPVLLGLIAIPLLPIILLVALIVWLFNRDRRPTPVPAPPR